MLMKKLILIFVLIVFLPSLHVTAQVRPKIRFGNVTPVYPGGRQETIKMTREEVISNPRLYGDLQDWTITSFTFGMLSKQRDFIGPFEIKRSALTPEIIKILQDLKDPSGRIMIENIKVKVENMPLSVASIYIEVVKNKK
jgi:hypothetical protein